MRNILALVLICGLLFVLNVKEIFGRIRAIDTQSRIECPHGDCSKRDYPWIESLYRKQDPFVLLNVMEQRRYNQPYYDYFSNLKNNKQQTADIPLLMDNSKKIPDPEVWKRFQYLQDHSSDITQPWQEHENALTDNSDMLDKNTMIDTSEENLNNSLSKRMFHRNQNYYDSFLALAGLGNFSLENLKQTRSQSTPADEKFTIVERSSCSCSYTTESLDLNLTYIPRAFLKYKCIPNSCSPPYSCKERYYTIWVLKKREDGDPIGDRNIGMLPKPFRKDYLFKEISVPVACECSI